MKSPGRAVASMYDENGIVVNENTVITLLVAAQ